jgi:glutamate dehydrogenase/leucine dehydrogenase
MGAACEIVFGSASLEGRSVLVQGAGKVGETLLDLLVKDGAKVAFTDVDRDRIAELKKRGIAFVKPDDAYAHRCDVFAPCALGGVLNGRTIPSLRCRIVVGAANNQLERPADAHKLQKRGIVYVPDFVANAGGAMAITGMEAFGWSEAEAMDRVRGIGDVARSILILAGKNRLTPDEAARKIAWDHLSAAKT